MMLGGIDSSWISSESPGVGVLVTINHSMLLVTTGPPANYTEIITIGQTASANLQT